MRTYRGPDTASKIEDMKEDFLKLWKQESRIAPEDNERLRIYLCGHDTQDEEARI